MCQAWERAASPALAAPNPAATAGLPEGLVTPPASSSVEVHAALQLRSATLCAFIGLLQSARSPVRCVLFQKNLITELACALARAHQWTLQ